MAAFAELLAGAVCVMCGVVWVSAGRNVLDSVPPTRSPPTHGRLCIYTSGSPRSPPSPCWFKSLPCICLSALFPAPGCSSRTQTSTHANTHVMQLNRNVCIAPSVLAARIMEERKRVANRVFSFALQRTPGRQAPGLTCVM